MKMEEISHRFGLRWAIFRDGATYIVKLYGNEVCQCASVEDALDEIALSEGVSEQSREAPHPGL
jgi:hypothetical protein